MRKGLPAKADEVSGVMKGFDAVYCSKDSRTKVCGFGDLTALFSTGNLEKGDNISMRTVGLLIESSRAYGRGLLRGIARFMRMHNDWSIIYQERTLRDADPLGLAEKHCDGVLARIDTRQQLDWLLELNVPVVELRGSWDHPRFPRIISDDRAVAEIAAQHLLARRCPYFAFCGFAGADYSQTRRDHFCAAIRAAGYLPDVYESPAAPHGADTAAYEVTAAAHEREMGSWLSRLPHPTSLMACNDVCGRQVIDLCHVHGLRVPDQIAVIGVDNDEVLCDLAEPTMSSVILSTERMGYEAAELLSTMMDGTEPSKHEFLIPPIGVMKRHSTDSAVVDDPCIAAALAFIREKACTGINVEHVLDHLADRELLVSRSTLDRRFRKRLRCSPKDQIIDTRLERVRQLLLETTYSVERIAELVGFASSSQLATAFKHRTGKTPSEFRAGARYPVKSAFNPRG
jgi:LacI family transcriptional regulator